MKIAIDTNILSKICYPKPEANKITITKFKEILDSGKFIIFIPEICEYELRRSLLLNKLNLKEPGEKALLRLEELLKNIEVIKINSNILKTAAQLWAEARSKGYSTAGDKAIDADVILAAQALDLSATVITENRKHLERYVETKLLSEILIS